MLRRLFLDHLAGLPALTLALVSATPRPKSEPKRPALDRLAELEAAVPTAMCFTVAGEPFELISWSSDQWDAMDEDDLPPGTGQDSKDGRFVLRRVADDGPLEDLSPDASYAAFYSLAVAREAMERRGRASDRRRVADALRRCRRLGADEWHDLGEPGTPSGARCDV